jgi:hypothetical protein
MTKLRLSFVAAVAAMALTPAAAHAEQPAMFDVSQPTLVKGAAGTAGNQHFVIGPFEIECSRVRATADADPEEIVGALRFSKCEAHGGPEEQALYSKVSIKGTGSSAPGVEFVNFPGGGPGITGTSQLGSFELKLTQLNCTINVGTADETFRGETNYRDEQNATRKLRRFPTGFQQYLQMTTFVGSLEASWSGTCGEFAPVTNGSYEGEMIYESSTENIGWEPPH